MSLGQVDLSEPISFQVKSQPMSCSFKARLAHSERHTDIDYISGSALPGCDYTAKLGGGLTRLKSTARVDAFFYGIYSLHRDQSETSSIRTSAVVWPAEIWTPPDSLHIDEYLSSFQTRYVELSGRVLNYAGEPTTITDHGIGDDVLCKYV